MNERMKGKTLLQVVFVFEKGAQVDAGLVEALVQRGVVARRLRQRAHVRLKARQTDEKRRQRRVKVVVRKAIKDGVEQLGDERRRAGVRRQQRRDAVEQRLRCNNGGVLRADSATRRTCASSTLGVARAPSAASAPTALRHNSGAKQSSD